MVTIQLSEDEAQRVISCISQVAHSAATSYQEQAHELEQLAHKIRKQAKL